MKIDLLPGNIRRGHFYIDRATTEIPADAWGGRNASEAGSAVIFEFEGTGERVNTDIDGRKRIPRNARGQCIRFFAHHGLHAGDQIEVTAMGTRHYRVVPLNRSARSTVTVPAVPAGNHAPERTQAVVRRVVRDTSVTIAIKELYACRCQVCGTVVAVQGGEYAEGAHIRPLGAPHNGPDVPENVLCLCPNHHVMLDGGSLTINDDFSLNGAPGKLNVDLLRHRIDVADLRYHRGDA